MALLLLGLALLLASAAVALLLGSAERASGIVGAVGGVAGCLLGLFPAVRVLLGAELPPFSAPWDVPYGSLSIAIDPLSAFFLAPLFVLGGLATVYGREYLTSYLGRKRLAVPTATLNVFLASMAIALALLGSLFLAYAAVRSGLETSLLFDDLVREAPRLSRPWLHSAFVLLFVGYGTKMGLAPMHTWKPDAYGESPGLVGALLAGGLTSCAFLALLRFYQICAAAGEVEFVRQLMLVIGLLSIAVAGVFMARQRDFKRMLAYSSVEHMGILVLGLGIGGAGVFGALLHLINNGLTKGVLFLSAGNIHRAYGSKLTVSVSGALRRVPASGALFLAGFFAVTGSPPFGPFLSEFTILRAAIDSGQLVVAGLFLGMLFIVFVGMGATVLSVVQGEPSKTAAESGFHDSALTVGPIVAFLALVLLLGVYIPPPVNELLHDAARFLGAEP